MDPNEQQPQRARVPNVARCKFWITIGISRRYGNCCIYCDNKPPELTVVVPNYCTYVTKYVYEFEAPKRSPLHIIVSNIKVCTFINSDRADFADNKKIYYGIPIEYLSQLVSIVKASIVCYLGPDGRPMFTEKIVDDNQFEALCEQESPKYGIGGPVVLIAFTPTAPNEPKIYAINSE